MVQYMRPPDYCSMDEFDAAMKKKSVPPLICSECGRRTWTLYNSKCSYCTVNGEKNENTNQSDKS